MADPTPHEVSGTTVCLITRYVREHAGDEGVARLLRLARDPRTVDEIDDERRWSTYEQQCALMDAAPIVLDDPLACLHIGEAALQAQVGRVLKVGLRRLGSPRIVLSNIATANAKFTTVADMEAEFLGRDRAVVTYRLHEGKAPHRGDCQLNTGLLRTIGPLFGMPPLALEHPECQVDGALACRYLLSWPTRRRRRRDRGEAPPAHAPALQEQIDQLQSITADLVSSDDVHDVLTRIVGRAGHAVTARRFLLALYEGVGVGADAYTSGIDDEDQAALAASVLATEPGATEHQIVIEVRSSRRAYGRLAAYYDDTTFFPFEPRLLDAYARTAAAALDAASALEEARRQTMATAALLSLARSLAEPATPRRIARILASAIPEALDVPASAVLLWNDDRSALSVAGRSGWPLETARLIDQLEVSADAVAALFARSAGTPAMVVPIGALTAHPAHDPLISELRSLAVPSLAVAPIQTRQGEFYGLASVTLTIEDSDAASAIAEGLVAIADQGATALQNAELLEQIRHQALHDALTQLANRALFDEELDRSLAQARRDGRDLSVLFVDLDDFKAVNDRFGHGAGDHVLRTIADRLRDCGRKGDTVARLGGDEFAMMLTGASREDALRVATRVGELVGAPITLADVDVRIRASIGVATHPDDGQSADALMRDADRSMYTAKRTHRTTMRVTPAPATVPRGSTTG